MKRHLYLILSLAWAQLLPNLGGQRKGISALTFLKIDPSPRSAALASTQSALSPDAYATFYNPGALAQLREFHGALAHTFWIAGLDHTFATAAFPLRKAQSTLGVHVVALSSGAMEKRTEYQPQGTGEIFYALYLASGISFAHQFSEMFGAGVTLKYVREQLDAFHAQTALVDLGFQYKTDFRDLRFAVGVFNFGPNSRLKNASTTFESYPPPTLFTLAASIRAWKKNAHTLYFATALHHPNDNSESVRFALEYSFAQILHLRTGYKLGIQQPYPTAGIGIAKTYNKTRIQVDYAAEILPLLGIQHRIGMHLHILPPPTR